MTRLMRWTAAAVLAIGLSFAGTAAEAQLGYGPYDYGDYYGYYGGVAPGLIDHYGSNPNNPYDVGVYDNGAFGAYDSIYDAWGYGDAGFTGGWYGDGYRDDDWFYDYYHRPALPGYRGYGPY